MILLFFKFYSLSNYSCIHFCGCDVWNVGYIITQGILSPSQISEEGTAVFKGFFCFMGHVDFRIWLEWSGQHDNWITACCIIGNFWDLCFPSLTVHSWKNTMYCLMWSSQLSPLSSIPSHLVVCLHCSLLVGGGRLIRGLGSPDHPDKQWLLCSDYRYMRSGHRITSNELPRFTCPASAGR